MLDKETKSLLNNFTISKEITSLEKTISELIYDLKMKPNFSDNGFKAIVNIFTSVIISETLKLNNVINISIENRNNLIAQIKDEINKLVKIYTNINL